MSNAKDYILKDGDTGLVSSEEPMGIFTGIQNNTPDIDELHQLLGEAFTSEANDSESNDFESMSNTEYESSSVEDEHPVSALEELEELYAVSVEAKADDSETSLETGEYVTKGASDADSLMEEIEKLYGESVETEIDNTETAVEREESVDEVASDSVSLLEELEELFSGSTESIDTALQTSEPTSIEEDVSSMSALEELKAFLGDTAQDEAGDNEMSSASILESSFVSCRSVLDELQNLLKSCLDELKADAKSNISNTSIYTDAEYPSRDELKDLLETTLSQLMLFSGISSATTYTDSVSVLDEFKNFMHETGAADTDEMSDSLFMADGFDEPEESDVSSFGDDVQTDDAGADSILDELNLLLSDSDPGTFDSPLASDYSTSAISEESSERDELAAYMAELSDDTDIDDKTSVEETGIDTDSTDTEWDGALNTLEELEAMLNEIGISDNDKTSDSIKASEDDFSYEDEAGQPSTNYKEEKFEDKSTLYRASNVEVVSDNSEAAKAAQNTAVEDVHLLDEPDNNRVPVTGLLLTTVLAVGLYAFWSLLDSGDGVDSGLETVQSKTAEKTSVIYEKPGTSAWSEQSAAQYSAAQVQASEYGLEDEYLHGSIAEENSGAGITAEADTVYEYEPLEEIEVNSYEPISSYEDGSLTVETAEPGIDIKAVQLERIDDVQSTVEDIAKETISLEVKNLLQENKENIKQLQRRMTEAESSIAKLQEEKAGKLDDVIEPVQPALPEQLEKPELREKPELAYKQEIIKQPVQMVPVIRAQGKDGNLWSVQLSSYYGKPPPASELKYLEKAGISYEIKKAMVNEKVWYRVIVDEFSEYEKAKQFSDDIRKNVIRKKVIRKNVIRKDMWINKSQ